MKILCRDVAREPGSATSSCLCAIHPFLRERPERRDGDIAGKIERGYQPGFFSFIGQKCEASGDRFAGRFHRKSAPVECDDPSVDRSVDTEQPVEEFALAGSLQPRDSDDLA